MALTLYKISRRPLTLFFVLFLFFVAYRVHRNNITKNILPSRIRHRGTSLQTTPNNSVEKETFEPTTEAVHSKHLLILFWSTFFGDKVRCDRGSSLCNNKSLRRCRVLCEVTTDRKRAPNASVFIIHARDPTPLPPKEYSHIPWTLLTLENPVYTWTLYNKKFLSNFNYLMSYRVDKADFFLPTFEQPSIEPKPIPFANKTGFIAAVFSHCEPARTTYLKELMKHIHVDSYGGCLRNTPNFKAYYGTKNFVQAKNQVLRNYKFTIVFLNQDCDYFVDIQLTHALSAGSVPVYMGTDKVDELLGGNLKDSIIKVRNFATPKILAEFLTKVGNNETLYNKYLKWKYEGFQYPDSFLSMPQGKAMKWHSHPQYCGLCETIAEHRDRGQYKKKGAVEPDYCVPRKIEDWIRT